jgi:hypothetical protein
MNAKDLVKREIKKFRDKAKMKRYEADRLDKQANDLERQINNEELL